MLEIDNKELREQEKLLEEKYQINFSERNKKIKNHIEENENKNIINEEKNMLIVSEDKWYKKLIKKILSLLKRT